MLARILRRAHRRRTRRAWRSTRQPVEQRFPLALLLRRHPGVDALLEYVEGQRAGAEDGVVEGAHVEGGAEGGLGLVAQAEDRELTDLVAEGLARPDDVA